MVTDNQPETVLRWQYYALEKGEGLIEFWRRHLNGSQRRVLYVLGMGFDPRMCRGLECLVNQCNLKNHDVWLLKYDEGADSPSQKHKRRVEENYQKLLALTRGKILIPKIVDMESADGGRRIGHRNVATLFSNTRDFYQYTDIIFDISALPRNLYLPAITALLDLCDRSSHNHVNIHVLVWDDAHLDRNIREDGIRDQAQYLFPYGMLGLESTAHTPMVWMPLLGEGQNAQLRAIDEFLAANKEIVPVLPFPSFDPRRSDALFLEYRELLLEKLRVEPANFAYAAEQNPFAVYRQIMRIVKRYRQSLESLGDTRFVLSALSSKLFSLGALLAAYEMRANDIPVGVAHVECRGYNINEDAQVGGELFGLWLTGELYDS